MVTFTVEGEPAPKERPRVVTDRRTGKRHTYTPGKTLRAETEVAWGYRRARGTRHPAGVEVELSATFYRSTRRVVDLDNLVKVVLDGLNGIAYDDDRQVTAFGSCSIELDRDNPRTVITIKERTR